VPHRFAGGGWWTTDALADGDTLELREAEPLTVWWENPGVSDVAATSAWVFATLAGTNADVWCFCGTNNAGSQSEGWERVAFAGDDLETGRVSLRSARCRPTPCTTRSFLPHNCLTGASMWSTP
jgi:hypothetical protein